MINLNDPVWFFGINFTVGFCTIIIPFFYKMNVDGTMDFENMEVEDFAILLFLLVLLSLLSLMFGILGLVFWIAFYSIKGFFRIRRIIRNKKAKKKDIL